MDNLAKKPISKYLRLLPGIFQYHDRNSHSGTADFLGRFLLAFEKILSGIDDDRKVDGQPLPGIEQVLDVIYEYFDPLETPAEFLTWLAGWVGLTLQEGEGWDEGKKRRLIAQIVPLYKKRGTLEGLKEYLQLYFNEGEGVSVSISEFLKPLQIGTTSTIGLDTVVGEGRPYYFQVYMQLPISDRAILEKKIRAIMEIINQEKPAHTYCLLIVNVPMMQVAVHSMIGYDTLLGGFTMVEKSFNN
ncbi:MAG TPA: phage tail protein [Bacillota bacterium]|nr:phage tail protein [Bacillota bacterium]